MVAGEAVRDTELANELTGRGYLVVFKHCNQETVNVN